MRQAQDLDVELQRWIVRARSDPSSWVRPVEVDFDGVMVWCTNVDNPRVLVPTSIQREVFHVIHDLGHPGKKATLQLIKEHYFWPEISKDVSLWCKMCNSCQVSKVQRHTKSPLKPFPQSTGRFAEVNVDLVGPINPPHRGKNFLLTVIDRWTGLVEAYPLSQ
ncbi:choline ethanolamine kinase, partial [Paramuricea clavata]